MLLACYTSCSDLCICAAHVRSPSQVRRFGTAAIRHVEHTSAICCWPPSGPDPLPSPSLTWLPHCQAAAGRWAGPLMRGPGAVSGPGTGPAPRAPHQAHDPGRSAAHKGAGRAGRGISEAREHFPVGRLVCVWVMTIHGEGVLVVCDSCSPACRARVPDHTCVYPLAVKTVPSSPCPPCMAVLPVW
jgi:hypothetical protein